MTTLHCYLLCCYLQLKIPYLFTFLCGIQAVLSSKGTPHTLSWCPWYIIPSWKLSDYVRRIMLYSVKLNRVKVTG